MSRKKHLGTPMWIPGKIVSILSEKRLGHETLPQTLARLVGAERELDKTYVKEKVELYNVSDMVVGESKVFPYIYNNQGHMASQNPIYNAVSRQAKEYGREFMMLDKPNGVEVIRRK